MFNSLSGTVTFARDTELRLENSGVEWALSVPATSLAQLPGMGENARVLVYLHHREDQLALYGFATEEDRAVFLELLKVGGIGPRQALRILSGMSVDEFLKSLDNEDVARLSRVPGLGKKTAQKILLTLRGRVSFRQEESPGEHEDIVNALVEMGFDKTKAAKVVERTAREVQEEGATAAETEGELLRRAIVLLSSSR